MVGGTKPCTVWAGLGPQLFFHRPLDSAPPLTVILLLGFPRPYPMKLGPCTMPPRKKGTTFDIVGLLFGPQTSIFSEIPDGAVGKRPMGKTLTLHPFWSHRL